METPVEGGTASLLDSKVDGVGLPEDFSRFQNFTKAQYDAIYAKVVAGQVTIEKGVDAPDYVGLGGTKVKVTVIE